MILFNNLDFNLLFWEHKSRNSLIQNQFFLGSIFIFCHIENKSFLKFYQICFKYSVVYVSFIPHSQINVLNMIFWSINFLKSFSMYIKSKIQLFSKIMIIPSLSMIEFLRSLDLGFFISVCKLYRKVILFFRSFIRFSLRIKFNAFIYILFIINQLTSLMIVLLIFVIIRFYHAYIFRFY